MKIEIDDDMVDKIVHQEIKNWLEMAENFDGKHPDDIAFWEGMRASCDWILKNNWPSGS